MQKRPRCYVLVPSQGSSKEEASPHIDNPQENNEEVGSEVSLTEASRPSKLPEPTFFVSVPIWKPEKTRLRSTPLLSQYQLVYHLDDFIICILCGSAIPWNYLRSHLEMEWIDQPAYAPGIKIAHCTQLRANHLRVVDADLEADIEKEIRELTKCPGFLESRPWVKMPETCSAMEGIAMFEGVYCSQCKISARGQDDGTCKCGKTLQPATVQCLAYHWRECQRWFRVSTPANPPPQYLSAKDPIQLTVKQLRVLKIQLLSGFIEDRKPSPLPQVLTRLGLDTFCHKIWEHKSFLSIWKGIEQWPQGKVALKHLVIETAVKDYKKLLTANPSLKQLAFSNRWSVCFLLLPKKLVIIDFPSAQQVQALFTSPQKLQSRSMQDQRSTYFGPQFLQQNLGVHSFSSPRNRRKPFSTSPRVSLQRPRAKSWKNSFAQPSTPSTCLKTPPAWPMTNSSHLLLYSRPYKYQPRTKHLLKSDLWTRN